jgi:DNA-directed RNA polymerase specialized sigma24 family protein
MPDFLPQEAQFFEAQWTPLLRRLQRQFGAQLPDEELENLLADAYLRFREALLAGKVGTQWAGYWYRAAFHACIDQLKRLRREREALEIWREGGGNFVNNAPPDSHKPKSLMRLLLEALAPQGALADCRPRLREVLGHEGNAEGLFQLLEAAVGYLANPHHIRAILWQDAAYANARHKEAQARLATSKGGPNRAYELGSGKVMERLRAALDPPAEPWLENPRLGEALAGVLQAAEVPWAAWAPELASDFPEAAQAMQEALERPGQWPARALALAVNEPKFQHRPLLGQALEAGSRALAEALRGLAPKTAVDRFLGHDAGKTPRGLQAMRWALQTSLLAQWLRRQREAEGQ